MGGSRRRSNERESANWRDGRTAAEHDEYYGARCRPNGSITIIDTRQIRARVSWNGIDFALSSRTCARPISKPFVTGRFHEKIHHSSIHVPERTEDLLHRYKMENFCR